MRRLSALLLVAGLLLAAPHVLAAPGKGQSPDRARGPFQPVGAFELVTSERTATGDYVSFNYSEAGVADYRAANRTLFDLTVLGGGEDEDEDEDDDDRERGRSPGVVAAGNEIRVRMRNFTFIAHDNPTGVAKLETDGTTRVVFEEGVVLAYENGGRERVRFSFGDVTGVLRGDDAVISGRSVTTDEGVLIVLDAPRGPFKDRELGRAIGKGHVGAEATIDLDDDERVRQETVSYGNVTITTERAERGNITVVIDGHGFDGRVVVLNIDGRVLGADHADKLQIWIDNESVRPASNLTDILDPDDDGFYPEYYIVFDPSAQAFQLLATLPHYSVHILSVTTLLAEIPPPVAIGILVGVAMLVPTALVLFRRRS